MAIIWNKIKGKEKTKRARCSKCNNPLLLVIWEPVARQARIRKAHHMRVIARCPMCKTIRRITRGAPN